MLHEEKRISVTGPIALYHSCGSLHLDFNLSFVPTLPLTREFRETQYRDSVITAWVPLAGNSAAELTRYFGEQANTGLNILCGGWAQG